MLKLHRISHSTAVAKSGVAMDTDGENCLSFLDFDDSSYHEPAIASKTSLKVTLKTQKIILAIMKVPWVNMQKMKPQDLMMTNYIN